MQQTIIITGSRKGIGRFLVEYYINLGFNVVGCSRSMTEFVHQRYLHITCDVTDEDSAKLVVKEAVKRFKKIEQNNSFC